MCWPTSNDTRPPAAGLKPKLCEEPRLIVHKRLTELSVHILTKSPKRVTKDVHRFWPQRSEEKDESFFDSPSVFDLLVSAHRWPADAESFTLCLWEIKDSRDIEKSLFLQPAREEELSPNLKTSRSSTESTLSSFFVPFTSRYKFCICRKFAT